MLRIKTVILTILLSSLALCSGAQESKLVRLGVGAATGETAISKAVNRQVALRGVGNALPVVKIANLPGSLQVSLSLPKQTHHEQLSERQTPSVLSARVLNSEEVNKALFPNGWKGNALYIPISWKVNQAKSWYRGVALHNVDELHNILLNGMELSKSHHAGIFASSEVGLAMRYAVPGGSLKPVLPVVVSIPDTPEIAKEFEPDGLADFLKVFKKDIPARLIKDVMVFLDVNGESGWYKAELCQDGVVFRPVFGATATW